MHSNGITHRDIKPENILFSELGKFDSLKIIDFGIS
jgi:serine/threonine protein kinase